MRHASFELYQVGKSLRSGWRSIMSENSHTRDLTEEALEACIEFDWRKTFPPDRLSSYFARLANRFLKKRGYIVQDKTYFENVQAMLNFSRTNQRMIESSIMIQRYPERFDATYALFEDDESRKTFDWYIQNRVAFAHLFGFANEIFPSPVSKSDFKKMKSQQKVKAAEEGFPLDSLALFAFGQYDLPEYGASVQKGDVVIDVGGCSGDTAWKFRQSAGDTGKIYVFEPVSAHFEKIQGICKERGWHNVEALPYGLWNEQATANITVDGGSSTIISEQNGIPTEKIELMPLDTIVKKHELNRIDFIKMDIEGAEQNALLGCRETIERFAPKLAISIYHLGDDMVRIPQIINEMQVNYSFYSDETVFYAVPKQR
jgi:FkbM family methyltransferase